METYTNELNDKLVCVIKCVLRFFQNSDNSEII